MSLREHERRILAEIERKLDEEAPDLADRLDTFAAEDPDAPADPDLGSWKPWAACAVIAAVTAGLLVLLFLLTPGTPQPEPSGQSVPGTGESLPADEPAGDPVEAPGSGP